MSEPVQKPHRSKQDYETPRDFIAAVERRFGPVVHDLAAHSENCVVPSFYSKEQNALVQPWAEHFPVGNLWLNPEFGDIGPWAERCALESAPSTGQHGVAHRLGFIFLLTPASIGCNWFAEHVVDKAYVLGLRPRLSFDGVNPYPKDLSLSIFGHGLHGFDTWRWK